MYNISVKNKSSFIAPVSGSIYTFGGELFYLFKANKPFSLPKGEYSITSNIKSIKHNFETQPIFYPPEKNIEFKGIKQFVLEENPNKCSIYVELGLIIADKNFWHNINIVQKHFIIGHELGHYFYYSEHKADAYSSAIMLLMGFNPSQISSAVSSTLINEFRKNENKAQLIKK